LQPQPQDRYSNAGELLQALQKYQGVEVSRGKQTWESRLGLLSLAALLLLVPLGYLMLHVQPKPPSKAISNSKFNPVQYALDVKQAHEALLRQDYSFGLQMLNRYSSPNLERHRGFIWGTLKRELESALRQKIQYRTEHAHPLVSMQFSADNKKYVTLDSSRLCLVRNWPQGDPLFSLRLERTPRFACFSPDGKLLVILCDGTPQQPASTIEIREASTGQLQRRLQSSGTVFTHLVFTENTKFAAAWHKTSDQSSGGIQLWQADQDVPYAELYTKKAGLAGPGGIVFSHQHQHLFVATSESSIDIWDLSSGQLHHRIRGMQQLAHCMTLSADGNTLAVASKKIPVDEYDELGEPRSEITLWDTSHFKLQDTIAGHSKNLINTLAFAHSDPNLLFAGYDHGLLQIWNISSKELVTEQQEMFRATGASSVLSDSHICFTTDQPDIAIWSPALVKNSLSIGEIWSLAISPDGKMLAVGADDENNAEKKCLFLLETGMILREPWNKQAHQATVSVVAFAPDGQALYTVGLDRKLKRWNLTTRKVDWEVEAHNERGIRDLAVSPDGQLLATSGLDSKVLLWEAATGKAAGQLTLRNGNNMAKLAFHPHQPWLAIATDDVMFVYDYPKQRYILQADQLGNSRILAFDADGEKLYVGGQKPIIHVFDMVSKTLLTVMNTSSASAMAISPDNKVLVCASHNGEIKFWYVPTGQELASLKTHTKDIYALVFSPDGRTLYAGSRDGKLLWWQSGD
ncbi:MAG TPA: WD40 repeat domain-containing protein, partial [Gemmatales bacterium]|nr:WD40 repeat domain-containing protein [Gemmatales bacterium]